MKHVDGKLFTVSLDTVIECDHVMRLRGKGMPRRNGRGHGDLYLTFEVDFPDTLTASWTGPEFSFYLLGAMDGLHVPGLAAMLGFYTAVMF